MADEHGRVINVAAVVGRGSAWHQVIGERGERLMANLACGNVDGHAIISIPRTLIGLHVAQSVRRMMTVAAGNVLLCGQTSGAPTFARHA